MQQPASAIPKENKCNNRKKASISKQVSLDYKKKK
jgi:hypothetical protein